jgi:hypothetical protein
MVAGRIRQVADLELQSKIAYTNGDRVFMEYRIADGEDEMHVAEVL